MTLTGGCGCGAVRFEISEPLIAAAYCHCTRCQHRTGTGMQATAVIEPGSLSFVRGVESLESWHPERAGEGVLPRVRRAPARLGG